MSSINLLRLPERNRRNVDIPEFKNSFLESVPANKRNIKHHYSAFRNSFLESVPGKEWAERRYSGFSTASWRVFLERNRWNIGTSGVQRQLPGECSWKGIGGMSLFLGFRSCFLESVSGKE